MSTGGQATGQLRRDEIEAWWALVARILAFFLGATILGFQSFFATDDRLWITVAGIGLCGPTVAVSVATVLASLRGSGKGANPLE
jgi:hypothetical protein